MVNSYENVSRGSLPLNCNNTKHSTVCRLRYKIQHPSVPMADWLQKPLQIPDLQMFKSFI